MAISSTEESGQADDGMPISRFAGLTRRGFLTRTTVGAAAVGVLSAAPGLGATAQTAESDAPELSPATAEPLVAQVRDLATGEISVMSGLKEAVVRDPQLVLRLLRALKP